MFNPEYRITLHFIQCCEAFAAQSARIQSLGVSLPLRMNLQREAVNRSVHSSTVIEGNRLSFEQVVAVASNKHVIAAEDQKREVQNCLKSIQWVIQHKSQHLTEARLLKIHRMMTQRLVSLKNCGHYRKVQNYIVDGKGVPIFTPPAVSRVKPSMKSLFQWLKTPDTHPVVRSAVFHHQFVTIHPFTDGNGRVARLAAQWLLLNDGYDPIHTFGLDDFFANDRVRYYQMIQQARELDGDLTYWIDYVAEGLLDSIQRIDSRIRTSKRARKISKISLTPKQEELIGFLDEKGEVGAARIGEHMKINRSRVNQLIAPLVKCGLVQKKGAARATRYFLA